MLYTELNKFLSRPDAQKPKNLDTSNVFLNELHRIAQEPAVQVSDYQPKSKTNELCDIIAGNSCLDASDASSSSPIGKNVPVVVQAAAADLDTSIDEQTAPPHILHEYRQTKAFQTLLRRQAQAVRKIQRIKSSFSKKRQQITMLTVAPVGGKKQAAPLHQDVGSNQDIPELAKGRMMERPDDYVPSNGELYQSTPMGTGRNDASNIIGHVYVGSACQKALHSTSRSPKNYHEVVQRLTKGPLEIAEQRVALENQSFDFQLKQMHASRSRIPMSYSKLGIMNLPGPNQIAPSTQQPQLPEHLNIAEILAHSAARKSSERIASGSPEVVLTQADADQSEVRGSAEGAGMLGDFYQSDGRTLEQQRSQAFNSNHKYSVYLKTQRVITANSQYRTVKSGGIGLQRPTGHKMDPMTESVRLDDHASKIEDAAHVLGLAQNGNSRATGDGLSSYTQSMRQNIRVSSTSNVLGQRTNAGKSGMLAKTSSQSPQTKLRIQAVNSQNRIHPRIGNIMMYNSKKMGLGREKNHSSNLYSAGTTQDQSSRPQTSGTYGGRFTGANGDTEAAELSSLAEGARINSAEQDVSRPGLIENTEYCDNHPELKDQGLHQARKQFNLTTTNPVTLHKLNSPNGSQAIVPNRRHSYENIRRANYKASSGKPAKSISQLDRQRRHHVRQDHVHVYSSINGANLNVSSGKAILGSFQHPQNQYLSQKQQQLPSNRNEYGAAPANDRELKDLLRKVEKKNESDAMRLNRMYNEIMDQQEPEKKYMTRRRKIANNLKSKSYWPDGMKHPDQYRGFYWTNDLAFCGFATLSHQEKTIGMIKKAIDSTTNKSVQGAAASKKPPMSTKRAFAKVQTKMNAKERVYKSPLSAQNPTQCFPRRYSLPNSRSGDNYTSDGYQSGGAAASEVFVQTIEDSSILPNQLDQQTRIGTVGDTGPISINHTIESHGELQHQAMTQQQQQEQEQEVTEPDEQPAEATLPATSQRSHKVQEDDEQEVMSAPEDAARVEEDESEPNYTMPSPDRPLSESGLQYELPDDDAASGSQGDQTRNQPNRQSFGETTKPQHA